MKELISRKDINGVQLKEGDIIAEGKVGEEIWSGQAIIKSRPLGVVVVYNHPQFIKHFEPNETNLYNIKSLRGGVVEFTDKALPYFDISKTGPLYISSYDGKFTAWDDIEKIGSIYDFKD